MNIKIIIFSVLLTISTGFIHAMAPRTMTIHQAVAKGKTKAIRHWLAQYPTNIDDLDMYGCTPLLTAIKNSRVDIVRLLLEHGASVNTTSWTGASPLEHATFRANEDILRLLLAQGVLIGKEKISNVLREYAEPSNARLLMAWPQMLQQSMLEAKLTFCMVLHPKKGRKSRANVLPQPLLPEILRWLKPIDFAAIASKKKLPK
jgi:ankyrin repeat protein